MTPIATAPNARPPRRPGGFPAAASALLLAALLLPGCGSASQGPATSAAQLQFGVDMAKRGLWQEALFRFRQAERLDPDNPHVYNNLAVAYEANGDFDKALEYYQKALRAAPESREARGNYARFVEFYQAFKPKEEKPPGGAPAAPANPPQQPPPAVTPPPPAPVEPPVVDPSPVEPPPADEPPAEEPPARP